MSSFRYPAVRGFGGGGGGSTSPGGSDKQVQFNDGGVFAGDSYFTFDKGIKNLTVSGAGPTIPAPASGSGSQSNGGTLFAGGYLWTFEVMAYKLAGGFKYYGPSLTINFTDDNSSIADMIINLSWAAVSGADGYVVKIASDVMNGITGTYEVPVVTNSLGYTGFDTPDIQQTTQKPGLGAGGGVGNFGVMHTDLLHLNDSLYANSSGLFFGSVSEITSGDRINLNTPAGSEGILKIGDSSPTGKQIFMTNPSGAQSTMVWQAPATSSTGYYWLFGADISVANRNNFFIFDLLNNRAVMGANGNNGNVVFAGDGVDGVTAPSDFEAIVQIKGRSATTDMDLLSLSNRRAANIPLKIRGATSQTGALTQWRNVGGTNLLQVLSSGDLSFGEGVNLQAGTTTGTKIGTTTTQKLGFWNATPIVQPTVTGSRAGNAALASLLTQLASMGLIVNSTTA